MKLITLVVGVAVCLLADPWPFVSIESNQPAEQQVDEKQNSGIMKQSDSMAHAN